MRARCRPTDVRSSGPTPAVDRSPPAVFTFHQRRPRGFLRRSSAARPAPQSPATRPSAALPPDLPRVPACAAPPHSARWPAPCVPPRAGSAAWCRSPATKALGPSPSGAQALSLSPARAGPGSGGPGAPGRACAAQGGPGRVAGRGRALGCR